MSIGAPIEYARGAVRGASPWVKALARAGFASRGVVSCTIGVLAIMAALGDGDGKTTGSKGALREIHTQPFGKALLAVVAVGLFGFALFRIVEAVLDPERSAERSRRGPLLRIGRFASGAVHVALGVYALGLVTGTALGGGGGDEKTWTARVLGWDGIGVLLVGGFGLLVIGLAVYEIYKAARAKWGDQLDLSSLAPRARGLVALTCRFGMASRAAGFVAYGVYQLVEARFRRFDLA